MMTWLNAMPRGRRCWRWNPTLGRVGISTQKRFSQTPFRGRRQPDPAQAAPWAAVPVDAAAFLYALGGRDAVHAATALEAGIGASVSPDAVFDEIDGLTRIDPRRLDDVLGRTAGRSA